MLVNFFAIGYFSVFGENFTERRNKLYAELQHQTRTFGPTLKRKSKLHELFVFATKFVTINL